MKLLLYDSAEGSADLEEADVTSASDRQATPADFLGQAADFLRDHMVSVLVAASLVLIALLAACGAVFLSRRRQFNAYYPSAYPAKMYVDQRDKSGGARRFHEISDETTAPASHRESRPTDSHKQLQADIMRVAKSLRTPTKVREDASKKETSDESPPSPADKAIGPSLGDSAAEKPDDELATNRNLRPPSLHLHNDSATLQLIAGEKTAF